jgi:hypothetical protein
MARNQAADDVIKQGLKNRDTNEMATIIFVRTLGLQSRPRSLPMERERWSCSGRESQDIPVWDVTYPYFRGHTHLSEDIPVCPRIYRFVPGQTLVRGKTAVKWSDTLNRHGFSGSKTRHNSTYDSASSRQPRK